MASKEIGILKTRLSWEDDNNVRGLQGFKDDLKGLRSEMAATTSKGKDYNKSLKGLGEQSQILTRRLKTQKEEVAELKRRYDESVKVKGEDDKQTRNLASQYNNATAQMNKTEQQLDRVTQAIRQQTDPLLKLGKSLTDTGDKFQTVGRSMTDFGKSYSLRVTAPIVAGAAAVYKAATDYETAFAGVRKTVDATEEEFSTLSRGIRDMALEIPAAATEIARVAEAAGQLGIKKEAILGFTRTMTDLGVATNMSSDEAATALARFANITKMPQENFDKLGSSVVDLGNNFATMEDEIIEMALRLAGAGSQIGMTESEILGLSAALSSVGIKAEMGGSAISRVMVRMQVAATTGLGKVQDLAQKTGMSLRDMQLMAANDGKGFKDLANSLKMTQGELKNIINAGVDLENFAKVAGMSAKEFKKAFEDDAAMALGEFINGLGNAESAGESAINMLQEMGITEIRLRDSLLRAGNASELFARAISTSNNAWDENVALTNEAEERYKTTASQMKILMNRAKEVAITLGEALLPALIDAIKAAEPFIKQIESGAKAFSDMDEEQQRTILKMIALVAAVGPASVALGGLTTSIGGVLKIGGRLSTSLGKAGGAGMIGRIGLMSPAAAGPVGLAIAGMGALALGIYAVNKATYESSESILKSIQSRGKELDENDKLIASFEKLANKNRLSTDQMLRYMDILTELETASSEEAIKKLTDEQADLLEKSGLTNKEMQTFLDLNGKLVEKSPETAKAISAQGNAFVELLNKVKELNDEERQRFADDTKGKLTNEIKKQSALLADQKTIQAQIRDLEKERSGYNEKVNSDTEKLSATNREITELKERAKNVTGEELESLNAKIGYLEGQAIQLDKAVFLSQREADNITKSIGKRQELYDTNKKDLKAIQKIADEYEAITLTQVGITAERGRGLAALNLESNSISNQIEKLKATKKLHGDSTGEISEQIKKLETQKVKIDEARLKLQNFNKEAGTTVYKDVVLRTSPTPDTLNKYLAETITKNVNVRTERVSGPRQAYAKGTDYHPGGPFIAGEEGFELGRMGNKWEMLNFGHYNRGAGYEVFTHDESKKIIKALNRMPGYAKGVSPNGEAKRVVNDLNKELSTNMTGEVVIYTTVINKMNDRELSRHTYKEITRLQELDKKGRDMLA